MAVTVRLSAKAFVTKQEIREALFTETSEVDRTDDELNTLYNFVNWVSEGIESFVGQPVIQKTVIEHNDGGGEYIFFTTLPVASCTAVTEDAIELTEGTDYLYDPDLGAVRRLLTDATTPTASTFATGPMLVECEYIAGYGTQVREAVTYDPPLGEGEEGDPTLGELLSVTGVPEDFKLATYIWVQSLWEKGPANYSPEQGSATGSRAAIPYAVKEILRNRVLQVHWIGS